MKPVDKPCLQILRCILVLTRSELSCRRLRLFRWGVDSVVALEVYGVRIVEPSLTVGVVISWESGLEWSLPLAMLGVVLR